MTKTEFGTMDLGIAVIGPPLLVPFGLSVQVIKMKKLKHSRNEHIVILVHNENPSMSNYRYRLRRRISRQRHKTDF